MRTIAIVNQKGGCGKTTTAINLASLYARRGLRTLLVDMDPQSHCAAGLGVPESRIEYSIGDALLADVSRGFNASTLFWEVARNLHLAPSTMMLSALEAPGGGLHQLPDKDRRLENLLACMADRYDRCLIDCPPTIGLLTFNALRAAKEALIPVETGFFALRGAEKQWNTIQRMISHIGRPIACHLLPTLHNPNSQLACNILAALRRQFAGQILPVVIHEDEALREAASFGQPVQEYAPDSNARRDFESLADWLEEHAANPTVHIEVMTDSLDRHGLDDRGIGGGAGQSASRGGGRAAELARRVHGLNSRGTPPQETPSHNIEATPHLQDEIAAATSVVEPPTIRLPALVESPREVASPPLVSPDKLTHLFGVRETTQGVLFVQPGHLARQVSVVGDFNHWNATANPLSLDEQHGVFRTIIELPAGEHQYLLVADGEWIADPHNHRVQLNTYGEPNSLLIVRPLNELNNAHAHSQ